MSAPIRHVLVAGSGLTAWCAAAALKRRAPFLEVTLLATPPARDALADRISCTLPSLPGFQADLGIGEDDGVTRAGAGYRLGTRFSGWADGLPDYVHAYGGYGHAIGPAAFHLHWVRAVQEGRAAPFDAYCPAAQLARIGGFVPPSPGTPFAGHEYGLTLDLARHVAMMRAFALHVGVRETSGSVARVEVNDQGRVTATALQHGPVLTADLYIDATGPAALLRGSIDNVWQDWHDWLPCDRVLLGTQVSGEGAPVLTPVTAHGAGWHWSSGEQVGIAYSIAHLSDADAATMLARDGTMVDAPIAIRPGTRTQAWRGNCIAIGDAATQIEPLEWCNLHLALSAIDRLVTMLPDTAMAEVEAADFNRQTLAEAERVRDFLAAHYRTARRPEPMWQTVAQAEPPATLAHTLDQFGERGRLPFYEEETFTRDGWAAILLGQGYLPRRIDPLVHGIPVAEADAAMARMTDAIAAALPHVPAHAQWRAAQMRRLAR
ncbi:tryptophan 7-halogenase [Sphingomonas zeae]|jgi:tryptophan 7-halogenase|uniref:Tryptophan 7-halogenase n=1 Tax=Sphingomonas zeae TaxID=1646122 RepID=A0A7Y6B7L8_9SPHN|nr:tryptophan 7-halogenase [Sphingomonas zeae]MBB4049517.1 tryptophan halogenase [Sphingomonas zeae]NUU48193.1 tryptophan 7-halogenase [Sphingomonas zeae]